MPALADPISTYEVHRNAARRRRRWPAAGSRATAGRVLSSRPPRWSGRPSLRCGRPGSAPSRAGPIRPIRQLQCRQDPYFISSSSCSTSAWMRARRSGESLLLARVSDHLCSFMALPRAGPSPARPVLLPDPFSPRDDSRVESSVTSLVAADQQHSVPVRVERVDDPQRARPLSRPQLPKRLIRALQSRRVRKVKQNTRTAEELDDSSDILLLIQREPIPLLPKFVSVEHNHVANIGYEPYGVKSIPRLDAASTPRSCSTSSRWRQPFVVGGQLHGAASSHRAAQASAASGIARELLQKRQTDPVLEYFALCRRFWLPEFAETKLKEWESDVTAGREPQFGPHLVY